MLIFFRRKCKQPQRDFSRISCVSRCDSDYRTNFVDHGFGSRTNTKFILEAAAVVIILIFLAQYINFGTKEKPVEENEANLVPPNPTAPLPPSPSKLHVYKAAAVCADGPPCAEIGKDILWKNGSAVDAIIATSFCNGIVNMQSMGLGGGFLMTIYIREERKAYSLNARETAPINAKNEPYEENINVSAKGPLAMGVPGELKGYWEAHQRFGKLPWDELVQPSIDLCEKGYNMSKHQYWALSKNKLDDPNFREWFLDEEGTFKTPGSKIIPKKLCETLKIIAEQGADSFYTGELSKVFLDDVRASGGIIQTDDLELYEIEWQDPVQVTFENGDRLFSAPAPGSGALLGFILNILDGYKFDRFSLDSIESTITTYHRIIEAFKYAYAKRTELADSNFVNISNLMNSLSSKEYANRIMLKINDHSTSSNPTDYGAKFYTKEDRGTAHLAVLAQNGDAVSLTSSVNIYFGAGLTSKRTGIILNSIMNDFSFPRSVNYFGLPSSPNNKMEPGKRPVSSMAPTVVTDKNGEVKMVVGAAGGPKITTTVAQTIMRALWFGDSLKEAVDAPRIHHQLFPMHVEYEYGTLQQVVDGLKALGHKLERNAGSITCALLKKADYIMGNADYRKGGEVFGIT